MTSEQVAFWTGKLAVRFMIWCIIGTIMLFAGNLFYDNTLEYSFVNIAGCGLVYAVIRHLLSFIGRRND